MKITVKAPAKINLTLDIVGKRADGYHDVAMVMQTVSLYDTVTVEKLSGEGDGIAVSCPGYPDVHPNRFPSRSRSRFRLRQGLPAVRPTARLLCWR